MVNKLPWRCLVIWWVCLCRVRQKLNTQVKNRLGKNHVSACFIIMLVNNREVIMLHVDLVLQHFDLVCCTRTSSCNIITLYVARRPCLATFWPRMLHVDLVLQHYNFLCCTWTSSCYIITFYVARGPRLATFWPRMLHVDLVLQHFDLLCCTWTSSCNIHKHYPQKSWDIR